MSTSAAGDDPATGLPSALAAAAGAANLDPERVAAWRDWVTLYRQRLSSEARPEAERRAAQEAASPAIVPRNHVLVDIIGQVEEGDFEQLNR